MIICKNCGTVYDEFFNVCPKCGTVYDPEEDSEHDVPKREMPQVGSPINEYHREADPSATVIISRDSSDNIEETAASDPAGPSPYQNDALYTGGNSHNDDDNDRTIPVAPEFIPVPPKSEAEPDNDINSEIKTQPEARSRGFDPDATVLYSSSEEAGLPVQPGYDSDDDDKTLPVPPEFIPVKENAESAGNIDISSDVPVQPEARSRGFDPDATVLYSSSKEAGLPSQPGYVFDEDDDSTIPIQQETPAENVMPEPSENNVDSIESPSQEEARPRVADPDATVLYSSSKEAGLPPLQANLESENIFSASQKDAAPVTMPNSQYGDDFTTGSPTSSAPPEQPVSDFANTQDIVIPPAAQQPVNRETVSAPSDYPVPPVPPVTSPSANNSGMSQEKKPKKKGSAGKIIAIILVCCVVLAGLGVGAYFLFFNNTSQEQNEDPESLGDKYLSQEKWEDAIVQFKKAIEADPNNPELYLKLADAYEGNGDTANAILTLEQGYEKTNSDDIKARLDKLKSEHPDSTPENLQQNALSLSRATLSLYNSVKGGTVNADSPTDKLNGLNPSKLPSAGALQEDRDKAANELTVQDAIIYAGLTDKISSSDIGSYVYTSDHQIRYNGDAVGTTLKMDMTIGEIINGPAEKPDEDSSDEESDSESSDGISTENLVGTWQNHFDPDMFPPEQQYLLQFIDVNTQIAIKPDGTFDSYMMLNGKYSKLGTGTWTLDEGIFKVTNYGQTTEYDFKDGKLYDKSYTNGGVYFEKISSDLPEESQKTDASEPTDKSEPEEESSEPEVSDEPYDGNTLGTIKFIKPAEWPDNNVAIVIYEDDIGALFMNLIEGDDGLYYATIMKDNDNGLIYTKPRIKFHAEASSGESFESEYFNFSGDKTYRLEKNGSEWIPVEQTGSDNTEVSDSDTKPSSDYSTYAAAIDLAFKDYYALVVSGSLPDMKLITQSQKQQALKTITVQQALDYADLSDYTKYFEYISVDDSGTVFAAGSSHSKPANATKTSALQSEKGAYILADLYK